MSKHIKIESFTHPERGIVAGVLVVGRARTEVSGAFISVDGSGVPCVYGPISRPAADIDNDLSATFDQVLAAGAAKTEWADKHLSEGLSFLGLFRRGAITVIEMCARAHADEGRQPSDEALAEIRQAFISAMTPVVAAMDSEALNALRAASSFTRSDFAFYARGDGGAEREKRRMLRLQAASIYPILATTIARNLLAKLAVDGAKPLSEALIDAFGRRDQKAVLGKGALRRLQGLDWPVPSGVTPEWLTEKVGALPPDWFPKTPEEWRAFLDVARALGRSLPNNSGFAFQDLVAGCGGKWIEFRRRLAKAYTDTRPPENLDEDRRREWLRNPIVPEESYDALHNAVIDLEDMIEKFSRLVVLPAAASLGGEAKPFLGEPQRAAARHAAAYILLAGKNATGMLELSRHFTTRIEHVLEAAVSEQPRKKPQFKQVADDGWAPLCNATLAPNGVLIVPLTDPRELADEGRGYGGTPSRNADGTEGLRICVGDYSHKCRQGSHILSFRFLGPDNSFKRLSTIEIQPVGERALQVRQHKGNGNGTPPAEASEAWDWFRTAVSEGRIPINYEGIRSYLIGQVTRWNDDVERACGFEWRAEGTIERALRAFDPYLGKGLRNLPLDRFLELPEIAAVASEITPRLLTMTL